MGRNDVEHARACVTRSRMIERHAMRDAAAAIVARDEERSKPSCDITSTWSCAIARFDTPRGPGRPRGLLLSP